MQIRNSTNSDLPAGYAANFAAAWGDDDDGEVESEILPRTRPTSAGAFSVRTTGDSSRAATETDNKNLDRTAYLPG